MPFPKLLKDIYWAFPLLTEKQKESFFYKVKKIVRHEGVESIQNDSAIVNDYIKQILDIPTARSNDYTTITKTPYKRDVSDPKLIAYYLPQMHPTPENDAWWGKGITEWNNVSRAVPQYVGHYQPRLPGELGFYDLRLKDNLKRQIELAKMYGIYGFSWYYYWFDGKRLLERPLDMFLNDSSLDFPFCLCWANENWTKGFFGSSKEIIMKQNETEESYRNFIHDAIKYLKDDRYITVQGKKMLIVYKPHSVPNCKTVLEYWREYCQQNEVGDLYILGCWTGDEKDNVLSLGFDAETEFQPGSLYPYNGKINHKLPFINEQFIGEVYSYSRIVQEKFYRKNFKKEKMYNAVMPMWDNTPRRNNQGNRIFHGSTPTLYKSWLKDVINHYQKECMLDEKIIFINAWNEWGEGAYLEPDRNYGYAYLEATKNAIETSR